MIGHRTSPTNMGLALLANLSAYDFGYITPGKLIERTANAFRTMEALERHRGHFYNWYDTQSLKPLLPAYISTVDSGNLAGHLLTLRQGLLALPDHDILGERFFDGLRDTLRILVDTAGGAAPAGLAQLQEDLGSDSRPTTLAATGSASTGWRHPPRRWWAASMPETPRTRRTGGHAPLPGSARTPSKS